ncbi:MAG: glycosyltransferase family 2 protein [Crocinitomicaceae bacterium]
MVTVTTVIPCYNCEDYILETVNSVLDQSHKAIELICVNNNSSDSTLQILHEIAKSDNRVLVLNETQPGANFARNKGLSKATGKYIQFLDSDDVILEKKFELQTKVLETDNLDIVVSDRAVYNETLVEELETITFPSIVDQPLYESIEKIIITGNPLYRTDFVKKIGGYLPELISAQDWEFHIRCFLNNPKMAYLPTIFLHSRQLPNSLSSNFVDVSHNSCSVIEMHKDKLMKNTVYEHKGALRKILFTYLVSYVYSGSEHYKSEFVYWNMLGKDVSVFNGINKVLLKVLGPKIFLKIKRKIHLLKGKNTAK